jgi:hypothetical protein
LIAEQVKVTELLTQLSRQIEQLIQVMQKQPSGSPTSSSQIGADSTAS